MTKLSIYFKELKKSQGLTSDYQVAKFLGVSKQYAYRVMESGRLSDVLCIKIAKVLGIDPLEIISLREAEKAKDRDAKSLWVELHTRTKEARAEKR